VTLVEWFKKFDARSRGTAFAMGEALKHRVQDKSIRSITGAVLAAVLVFPVVVLTPAQASVTHSISGAVVDSSDTSKSVSPSRVDLYKQGNYVSQVATSSGTLNGVSYSSFFQFSGLEPGNYSLRANFTGVRNGSIPVYQSGQEIAVVIGESVTSTNQVATLSLEPYTRGPNSLTITPVLGAGETDASFGSRDFYYELYCSGVSIQSDAYTQSVQGSQPMVFSNLPSGQCRVYGVVQNGTGLTQYFSTDTTLNLGATQATNLNLEFYRHNTRTLSGVVKGSATTPAETVGPGNISASWQRKYPNGQTHYWSGSATIASNGSFSFTGAPNGDVSLSVYIDPPVSPYSQWHEFKVPVTSDSSSLDVTLSTLPSGTSTLNILVSSTSGVPVPGASVNIQYLDQLNNRWVSYGQTLSDSEGKITKTSMPAGYFYFWVSAQGFEGKGQGSTVTSGATAVINLPLFAKGDLVVSGVVRDSKTGNPVPGAVVQLEYGSGDMRWSKSTQVDSSGRYSVAGVINETITVRATGGSAKGYLNDFSAGKTLVMSGSNKTLDLELEPYVTGLSVISGTVSVFEPGSTKPNKLEPAAGVAVQMYCENKDGNTQYYDALTSSSGAY
jgi:hypothetical protein